MSIDIVYRLARQIDQMKPGMALRVNRHEISNIMPMQLVGHFGPEWNVIDQIMEKVVGSAYSIYVWDDPRTGDVTFHRLNEPLKANRRTYVSPDRREHFTRDFDGYYVPKPIS